MLLDNQFGFRPYRGRIQALSILQRLIESSGTSKAGVYAIYVDLEQCFDRMPRRKLRRALRKRGIPKKFVNFDGTPTLTLGVEYVPNTSFAHGSRSPVAFAKALWKDLFWRISIWII